MSGSTNTSPRNDRDHGSRVQKVQSTALSHRDPANSGASPSVRRYATPTTAQLEAARVQFFVLGSPTATYRPEHRLSDSIERYLPPAGEYYDEYDLDAKFGSDQFDTYRSEGRCTCCWGDTHGESVRACRQTCEICQETSHRGKECTKMYVELLWWTNRGLRPRQDTHIRPRNKVIAHLVVAGVFLHKPSMSPYVPFVVNRDHPVVRTHYMGKEWPRAYGHGFSDDIPQGYGLSACLPPPPSRPVSPSVIIMPDVIQNTQALPSSEVKHKPEAVRQSDTMSLIEQLYGKKPLTKTSASKRDHSDNNVSLSPKPTTDVASATTTSETNSEAPPSILRSSVSRAFFDQEIQKREIIIRRQGAENEHLRKKHEGEIQKEKRVGEETRVKLQLALDSTLTENSKQAQRIHELELQIAEHDKFEESSRKRVKFTDV